MPEHEPSASHIPPADPEQRPAQDASSEASAHADISDTQHHVRSALDGSLFPSCAYASVTAFDADARTAKIAITADCITGEEEIAAFGNLLSSLARNGCTDVTIDFGCVRACSSSALGKLVTLYKKMRTRETDGEAQAAAVHLTNMQPDIAEVFSVTKLDRIFDVQLRKEEAAGNEDTPAL